MPSRRASKSRGVENRRVSSHIELGRTGEAVALDYLKDEAGFEVVATNFEIPIGRGLKGQKLAAEIDIIAYDGDELVFVEVKTRSADGVALPESAVDLRKRRQIVRGARAYRRFMNLAGQPHRYDVVTVVVEGEGYRVEHLRGYFDERVFGRARFFRGDGWEY